MQQVSNFFFLYVCNWVSEIPLYFLFKTFNMPIYNKIVAIQSVTMLHKTSLIYHLKLLQDSDFLLLFKLASEILSDLI